MAIKLDDFSYVQELNWIKRVARLFIEENKYKCDWDGDPVTFFTDDIVEAVMEDEDYQDFPEHKISKDEVYEICEEIFLASNECWDEDVGMAFMKRYL